MAVGEDLLLLAIHPRRGTIRSPERIAFALRAGELVDLVLAGRVTVEDRQIEITDATPTGNDRLDDTLAAVGSMAPATVQVWVQGALPGIGMRYLSGLEDQHAVQLGYGRRGARTPRITVRDPARRAAVQSRVDRVLRGESAAAQDQALAGLVYAAGLDTQLYRGAQARAFRERVARLGEQEAAAATLQAVSAAAESGPEASLADAVARALADGVEQTNRELIRLLRHEYALVIASSRHAG